MHSPLCFCFVLFYSVVGLDIQDDMGRHEVGYVDNTKKIPINNGQGCLFYSAFTINKVSIKYEASDLDFTLFVSTFFVVFTFCKRKH